MNFIRLFNKIPFWFKIVILLFLLGLSYPLLIDGSLYAMFFDVVIFGLLVMLISYHYKSRNYNKNFISNLPYWLKFGFIFAIVAFFTVLIFIYSIGYTEFPGMFTILVYYFLTPALKLAELFPDSRDEAFYIFFFIYLLIIGFVIGGVLSLFRKKN